MMIASYATISVSAATYTDKNVAAWIEQVNSQAKILQNLMSPTDKDITDTSTLLATMQSNLLATPDSSIQKSQIDQLKSGIRSLESFLNLYAYTFTNNTTFSVKLSPAMQLDVDKTTRKEIILDSTKTSAVQYKATPFTNVSVLTPKFNDNPYRFEPDSSQNTYHRQGGSSQFTGEYRTHYDAPAKNASYDIVSSKNSDGKLKISLTKTSDSGKNYTNKTGYTIRMTSKPKKHKDWKSFNLEPGQSTGKASNDSMERVHIYVPKDMPKKSTAIASLAPGKYAINYDKATNQLSLDLVA